MEGELSFALRTHSVSGNGCGATDVKCMLTNTRSTMNKLVELKDYVDQYKPDIIAITETWCASSVDDAEVSLNDYNLYRCDRKGTTGGGVLMYVHVSLRSVTCEPLAHLEIEEAVWCLATLRNQNKLLIGTIYRLPCK